MEHAQLGNRDAETEHESLKKVKIAREQYVDIRAKMEACARTISAKNREQEVCH